MADPTDPLGVLDVDPKKLELIRQFFKQYTGDANLLSKQLQAVGRELGFVAERTTEAAIAEAEIRDMYKSRAALAKNINEVLSSNKQIRDEELKNEKAALVQAEQAYIKSKERLAMVTEELRDQAALKRKVNKEAEEEAKLLRANTRISKEERKQRLKANTTRKNARLSYLNSLGKEKDKLEQLADVEKARIVTEAENVEKREKLNRGMDTSVASLDSMIEKTGLFSEKWKTGPLGGLTDFIQGGGDMNDLFDELKLKADKINFSNLSANILTSIIEGTTRLLLEFDKLASSFRKNTGIIDRGFGGMEQSILNVQRANLRMGVSMDEAFAAANSLVSGMAQFTSMSDKAQDKVLQVTAVMQEFGVSAQTTSEIFNTFSKGLGYNADELEKLGTQIMGIATSLQVPPQIIATEFNAASKELMKYGGEMMGVFKGLAEQSKQTGIAIGELMGIVKQYDTFEGAGEAVGKLNAILGGPYLNSINMLYATEEDRVKMLRESISLSGRQFKDLSRFEQQAIATAAGISDMSQAAKLFGGTASEFANSRMEMKEMQERAAKAQSTMDKFTQVMQTLAIALGPLITALGFVAEAALILLNPLGEIAALFGADSDVISGLGIFTMLLYGTTAAIIHMTEASIALGTALSTAFLPVVAGVATFLALQAVLEELPAGMRALAGALIAVAAGWAAVGAGIALAGAIPSGGATVGMYAGFAALTAASLAGVGAMLSGLDSFEEGKSPGEPVAGGRALVAENGEELVVTANGQTYRVDEPSVVQLGTQDTVLNNAETKAAMAGGGGEQLKPLMASLQTTLLTLTQAINTAAAANTRDMGEKQKKTIVIKMDGRKVGESTAEYIDKYNFKLR